MEWTNTNIVWTNNRISYEFRQQNIFVHKMNKFVRQILACGQNTNLFQFLRAAGKWQNSQICLTNPWKSRSRTQNLCFVRMIFVFVRVPFCVCSKSVRQIFQFCAFVRQIFVFVRIWWTNTKNEHDPKESGSIGVVHFVFCVFVRQICKWWGNDMLTDLLFRPTDLKTSAHLFNRLATPPKRVPHLFNRFRQTQIQEPFVVLGWSFVFCVLSDRSATLHRFVRQIYVLLTNLSDKYLCC